MSDRPIRDLLDVLPDEVAPDRDFAERLRRDIERELRTRGPAPSRPDVLQEVVMLQELKKPRSNRTPWIAAAAALVAVVIGAVVIAATRTSDSEPTEPADRPPPGEPDTTADTLPTITPRDAAAVTVATDYFSAFGEGDTAAVLTISDPVTIAVDREAALVEWWSGAASPTGPPDWPSGPCRPVGASGADSVLIECPLTVTDPVAVELGADRLVWSVDVSDDGIVTRRAEPLTTENRTYQAVWSAHADFLATVRPEEYAASCDPATTTGDFFAVGGLALTGPCGDSVAAASQEAAEWIAAGRPEPTSTDAAAIEPADEPAEASPSEPAEAEDADSEPAASEPTGSEPAVAEPAELAEIELGAESLVGYWTNVGGRSSGSTALLVDFRRDGSFTIGNTGALGDGAFTGGSYSVDGDTIVFDGVGGGCDGETFEWDATRFTGETLDVEVVANGGCASDVGWSWVRVSPASSSGRALPAGDSGATAEAPAAVSTVRGIWLRVGTGEVLVVAADGSYWVTTDGDTLAPDDAGTVVVESPGTLVFESDGTGDCPAAATWTWTDVTVAADLLRVDNPRGSTMRAGASDLCGSSDAPTTWRLLSPDRAGL